MDQSLTLASAKGVPQQCLAPAGSARLRISFQDGGLDLLEILLLATDDSA